MRRVIHSGFLNKPINVSTVLQLKVITLNNILGIISQDAFFFLSSLLLNGIVKGTQINGNR